MVQGFFIQIFESMSIFTDLHIVNGSNLYNGTFSMHGSAQPLYDNLLNGGALIGSAIAAPPKKFN